MMKKMRACAWWGSKTPTALFFPLTHTFPSSLIFLTCM